MKPHLKLGTTACASLHILDQNTPSCALLTTEIGREQITKQPWKPCLLFAYQFGPDGTLHKQTAARCRVAAREFHAGTADDIFLTAHVRLHDMADNDLNGLSLVRVMQEYLFTLGVPDECIHVIEPDRPTNTVSEVQVFRDAIYSPDVDTDGHEIKPVFVSSWYHGLRIKMIWERFHLPFSWWSYTAACTPLDLLLEPVKILWHKLVPKWGVHKNPLSQPGNDSSSVTTSATA